MGISRVRVVAAACGLLLGSAVAHAATGDVSVYPNYGSYCSASQCGSAVGSASGTTLSDGKTVVAITEGSSGSGRYIGIYVSGFSSDPGAAYLHGAYCDGAYYGDNGYHSYYGNGVGYWQWSNEEAFACFGNSGYPSDGPHSVTIF
jgi:hypothetical protein